MMDKYDVQLALVSMVLGILLGTILGFILVLIFR